MYEQTVFESFTEKEKEIQSEPPFFGGPMYSNNKQSMQDVIVRYFIGVLTNESDVVMIEHIMTKSLNCEDQLKNPGDVLVISEQGTFDKDGCYNVVVKYLEKVDPGSVNKDNVNNDEDVTEI